MEIDGDDSFDNYSEVSGSDDYSIYTEHEHGLGGFEMMEDIRKKGKLCDVTIKVEDQCFSAHRIVLASIIPYFNTMFTGNMAENKQKEITMQGLEPSTLEALINFAYSGRIKISSENVQSLLIGSSFLQLTKVIKACSEFLIVRLHSHNVLGVRAFADSLGVWTLVEASNRFIDASFERVSKSEEFAELPATEVEKIISRDKLDVSSEEVVFEAVIQWVNKELDSRTEHLPMLLSKVRLPFLTPQYLLDRVATENLIRSSHECRDLLDEAKDYHLVPERRSLFQSLRTKPRLCQDGIGYIYAVGGLTKQGDAVHTVEYYDPKQGAWHMAKSMEMERSRVGVVVRNQILYAMGGYDGCHRLSTVEAFNPKTNTWSCVAPMNWKRSAVGAAVLNDYIYVCGGYNGDVSLSTVERFDARLSKWEMVSSMNKMRSAAGVVALGGYIYAVGGHNSVSIFDSVEKYDPSTDTWTEVTPMLSKRCRLGCAVLNGRLYACGGYDGSTFLRSCEVYDPISSKWSYVSSMNVIRSRVALAANCGKLFAIGGYNGVSNLNTVEVYDPENDKWSFIAPMCAHEGGVGVGVITERLKQHANICHEVFHETEP